MIFGNDDREEAEQAEWLEAALNDAGGRRIAWFTHRPLFIDSPDEGDTGYWSVNPEQRRHLLDLMQRHHVQFVATGHLHRWHDWPLNGTRFIWGPATGFLVGPGMCPGIPYPGTAPGIMAVAGYPGAPIMGGG